MSDDNNGGGAPLFQAVPERRRRTRVTPSNLDRVIQLDADAIGRLVYDAAASAVRDVDRERIKVATWHSWAQTVAVIVSLLLAVLLAKNL